MSPVSVRTNRGFTLIELMVTLAVAVILLALAVPSFNDFFDKARVRGAADQVASMLATARGEAVKLDRNVSVSASGTTAEWCLGANQALDPADGEPVPAAVACDCATTPAACVVAGRTLVLDSDSFRGATIDAADLSVTFDSKLGTLADLATEQLILTSPAGKYQVRVDVSALGHVRSCVPAGQPAVTGVKPC